MADITDILYGKKGEYVYDPLSYASLLIESGVASNNWDNSLHLFLNKCEELIAKTKDGLIHRKEVVKVGMEVGFIDVKKVIAKKQGKIA